MEPISGNTYSTVDLLKFLLKNLKLIILVTAIGAVISIIASLVITPKFKSVVVIYPASTSSVSKALLTDMTMSPKDILKFGEEEETEQLLQVLKSDEIKARIIQKYQLAGHYGIDTSSKFYKTALLQEYDGNISFRKTEFQAIEIKVLDTDPEYAAAIANDISNLLDSVYNKIQKDRALKALELVERVYLEQENLLKQIEDSLGILSGKGVYDYLSQSKILSEAYSTALAQGNPIKANHIKQQLDLLAKYGNSQSSLIKQHEDGVKQLVFLKSKLTEARVDAYHELPHKYIVNPAQVSERKAYPVRWLIVVFSTLSTFVFAIFFLLILERIKILRKEFAV
jgi:capsular polysaccharide biosynthesis protein